MGTGEDEDAVLFQDGLNPSATNSKAPDLSQDGRPAGKVSWSNLNSFRSDDLLLEATPFGGLLPCARD